MSVLGHLVGTIIVLLFFVGFFWIGCIIVERKYNHKYIHVKAKSNYCPLCGKRLILRF